MKTFFLNVWRYGRWVLLAVIVLYVALVIYRIPFVAEQERSDEAVAFINAQAITMADVTGENLPPVPDKEINDSTIEGIDVNSNGIRDDAELSIFEIYPYDIKIRAALLQYAMALQLYITKVFDSETWKEADIQTSRGYFCLLKSLPQLDKNIATSKDIEIFSDKHDFLVDQVRDLVMNTEIRKEKYEDMFVKFITSTSGNEKEDCDLDQEVFRN